MNQRPHFSCPVDGCNVDMTEAVCEQCEQTTVTPLFTVEMKSRLEATSPLSAPNQIRIALQCPKGHWAEYACPKSAP